MKSGTQELRKGELIGSAEAESPPLPDFLGSKLNLSEFLSRHAGPYDPATDDYDRPPFTADLKEGKSDPICNAHLYHTKVPPRGIIPCILHCTRPGGRIRQPGEKKGRAGAARPGGEGWAGCARLGMKMKRKVPR